MQTSLHIKALVEQLQTEIIGATIVDTEFYRKQRAAYFYFKTDKKRVALGVIFHPAGYGTFLVPAGKVRVESNEKPFPIQGYNEAEVISVSQVGLDRVIQIELQGKKKFRMIIEAIGPNGNVWLIDTNDKLVGTVRKRDTQIGDKFKFKQPLEKLDPYTLDRERLVKAISDHSEANVDLTGIMLLNFMQKNIGGFNRTLAREVLAKAEIELRSDASISSDQLETLVSEIADLANRFDPNGSGYLYQLKGAIEVYPFKLSAVEQQPEKHKSLSMAILAMTGMRQTAVEGDSVQKQTTDIVTRAIKKLTKRLPKLEADIAKAANYDQYRRFGELLQIALPDIKKGMSTITVDDIYTDPVGELVIKIDPVISAADNVQRYFKKARKGKEGLALLERRLEISKQELSNIELIATELEADFDSASQRYESELTSLRPMINKKTGEPSERLPYREHTLSTGLRIYIGRQGADNDRTTFEFAKPYELWFHTQQCPGSHVVIKHPNKSFVPTKEEIEETAAIAAFHSKAKNDSMVPVIYTQRKYVRKPRKAKPGLVSVEREKSVMVAPTKPE